MSSKCFVARWETFGQFLAHWAWELSRYFWALYDNRLCVYISVCTFLLPIGPNAALHDPVGPGKPVGPHPLGPWHHPIRRVPSYYKRSKRLPGAASDYRGSVRVAFKIRQDSKNGTRLGKKRLRSMNPSMVLWGPKVYGLGFML